MVEWFGDADPITVSPSALSTASLDLLAQAASLTLTPTTFSRGGFVKAGDASPVVKSPTTTSKGAYGYFGVAVPVVKSPTPGAVTWSYIGKAAAGRTNISPRSLATWDYTALPYLDASVNVGGTLSLSSMPIFSFPVPPSAPPAPPGGLDEFDTATWGGNVVRPLFGVNLTMSALTLNDADLPDDWTYTDSVSSGSYGVFNVIVWKTKEDLPQQITFMSDIFVDIEDMTFTDPFDDATAVLNIPMVNGFVFPDWLQIFTNVDIYWVPATSVSSTYPCINPITNQWNMYLHPEDQVPVWQGYIQSIDVSNDGISVQCQGALYQLDRYYAKPMFPLRPKLVENMIERAFSRERRGLWTEANIVIDWEPNWKTYSTADWNKYVKDGWGSTRFTPTGVNIDEYGNPIDMSGESYSAQFGRQWTGFTTRNTGSWDKMLTGYVNNLLSILFTESTDGTGLQQGDQWTIMMRTNGQRTNRAPHMFVRRQARTPTYFVCYGQPGVEVRLNRDGGMFNNVVFANGKSYGDEEWSNFVQPLGTWTTWTPTAFEHANHDPVTHPNEPGWETDYTRVWFGQDQWGNDLYSQLFDGYDANRERSYGIPVVERYAQFPDGVTEGNGESVAQNWIKKDADPGWTGEITLQVDPLLYGTTTPKNKWLMAAGDVIFLKYFGDGTGALVPGLNKFHISQVSMNPSAGTVTLRVDTKFRDLLSVEEAMAKGRDSLSPIKALQVGKTSVTIQDLAKPWNNRDGSGCFPVGARKFERTVGFPYQADTRAQPPSSIFKNDYLGSGDGDLIQDMSGNRHDVLASTLKTGKKLDDCFYVPIKSGSANMNERWVILPVLMSQSVDISMSEFAIYDSSGSVQPCEFHVSVWYTKPNVNDMPKVPDADHPDYRKYGGLWHADAADAWDPVRNDGTTWREGDDGSWYVGSMPSNQVIGWGNYLTPLGYHPRRKGDVGAQMTGVFRDTAVWHFDLNQWIDFHAEKEVKKSNLTTIDYSCWVAVYVNQISGIGNWSYVMGRFYRKVAV